MQGFSGIFGVFQVRTVRTISFQRCVRYVWEQKMQKLEIFLGIRIEEDLLEEDAKCGKGVGCILLILQLVNAV
jgi:hypothetical protein